MNDSLSQQNVGFVSSQSGLLLSLSAIFITVYLLCNRGPFSKIPGPFVAKFTNLWEVYHARLGQRYMAVHKAHQRYGPIIRLAPNHISIADFAAIPILHGSGLQSLDKSPYYKAFISGEKASIFSTVDRKEHALKRRFYTGTFAPKTVKLYAPSVLHVLEKLSEKLDKQVIESKGQPVNLMIYLNYFALDALSTLAFGSSLGTLDRESDVLEGGSSEGIIKTIDEREHRGAVVGWSPFLQRWGHYMPDPFFWRGSHDSNELDRIARACIQERLSSGSENIDVLGHLIATQQKQHGDIDIDILVSEAITVLIAGTDATTNAMTAAVFLISTHPNVKEALRRELESALGKFGTPKIEGQISGLPYLNACVLEVLRYHSPTGMGLPRVSQGFEFRGHWFPAGTDVSVPTWTMQHDPIVFGPDPYIFRPERWIEDPSLIKFFMGFSSGARSCIGRNLAILELKMIVAVVFQKYDVEPQLQRLETVDKLMHKPTDESGWFTIKHRSV
ncbi:cytochrome P450 [Dendrothele bispora CBS 962.96]|uniref:Cytochrome P450 n=1 Tax=Dendrothele bispora (strain CBS 962.96) TaxID=1314807 RepID=A0A4S8KX58_DENBC|nr:cytochrome P450 [Dendrothele bispora CBS 962.96]